jgi:CTP synthase
VAGKGDLGGTMRLGAYPARLVGGSIVAEAYGSTDVTERHRHRYEVNNGYRDALTKAGLRMSGASPDGRLVEFVELDRGLHPFFVATQAHPELKSRPTRSHPLFHAFVGAVVDYSAADQLPVELGEAAYSSAAARVAQNGQSAAWSVTGSPS